MKKITCFFLVLLALVFIFPVLFLAVGSLMGKNELTDLLFPVLQEGAKGYASWKLFPEAGAAAADKGMEKTSAGHKKKKVRKSINLCFVLWCIAIYFTLYFLFKLKIV